jgi:hypothetical protein
MEPSQYGKSCHVCSICKKEFARKRTCTQKYNVCSKACLGYMKRNKITLVPYAKLQRMQETLIGEAACVLLDSVSK